jgi:DNA-binding NtrC family response regulator
MNEIKHSQTQVSISPYIEYIYDTLEKIAISGTSVLLVGEPGTEKESIAHLIHLLSGRRKNVFLTVNCLALLPEMAEIFLFGSETHGSRNLKTFPGVFEKASCGTIFFDNFGALNENLQKRVQNTLKLGLFKRNNGNTELPFNVRLITAFDYIKNDIISKAYRKTETIHSICPLSINLPPLRERPKDIVFLIEKLIRDNNIQNPNSIKDISEHTLDTLLNYSWPGNTRELQKVIDFAINESESRIIDVTDLPSYVSEKDTVNQNVFKDLNTILPLPLN